MRKQNKNFVETLKNIDFILSNLFSHIFTGTFKVIQEHMDFIDTQKSSSVS